VETNPFLKKISQGKLAHHADNGRYNTESYWENAVFEKAMAFQNLNPFAAHDVQCTSGIS
jgi:hypothetical protein